MSKLYDALQDQLKTEHKKEAEDFVKAGFKSLIAENKDYIAEGLVLKAPCGLLNRRGKRIITKIKYCDYKDL